MRSTTRWTPKLVAALLPFAAVACSDSAGLTGPAGGTGAGTGTGGAASVGAPVTLSLAVPASTGRFASVTGPALFDLVLTDAGSTLTLTRVAIVMRKIELKREDHDQCDDLPNDDDCEEFESGPRLFELPLDGSVDQVLSVDSVPAGRYDELEFEIHKPDDDTGVDSLFLTQNPGFKKVSIRVEGDFDGNAFVYETDLNEEQEVPLAMPIDVMDGGGPINVTFSVDVDTWFRDAAGNLIDPATANKGGPNEQLVENNIERSIDLFKDDDHDGEDDDSSGSGS
ncbi:MAG: hypothetical protein ACE5HF_08130 [Gemmatimonadota bacterium]